MPDQPRIIFMGTPQFAVPALRALAQGPYAITVVTQPDRPAGRGGKLAPPPVKMLAQELALPLLQPKTLRDPEFRARLSELRPEVTVLVAYGEYLAPSLLDLPKRGSINLHPSILPRWRGSTPIQSVILAGDRETGVSIIKMDKGLDTGPIIAQEVTPLGPEETQPELSERLAEMGAHLLADILPAWLRGEIEPVAQLEEGATLSHTLAKEDGLIDWNSQAEEIARRVRAFQPWPGTFTRWNGSQLKIVRARVAIAPIFEERPVPGTVTLLSGEGGKRPAVWTQSPDDVLELLEVQLAGKSPVEARALLSGYPQIVGSVLGEQGGRA